MSKEKGIQIIFNLKKSRYSRKIKIKKPEKENLKNEN